MSVRPATHAGDWYSGNQSQLEAQISKYFDKCKHITPVAGARILIGPHAGYTYSGARLAETFASWDSTKVKRVFILGPSHHVYFKGKALVSKYGHYATPLGALEVDTEVTKQLVENGPFEYMTPDIDEDEHSFEMHAPFVYHSARNLPQGIPTIVPIMISASTRELDSHIAELLVPYLNHEENTFVISSDFCHWGSRFNYTSYIPEKGSSLSLLVTMDRFTKIEQPIYKSIEELDKLAMQVVSTGSYARWKKYINSTDNTICGQKAVGIVLRMLEIYAEQENLSYKNSFQWINYSQSSQVQRYSDSSVSYASGYLVV